MKLLSSSRLVRLAPLLAALTAGACAHTVLDQPVDRRGDDWSVTVRKITNGPSSIDTGNIVYRPERGERFVWVTLTLRNDQSQPRKFSFDRCDLDAGGDVILPSFVTHDFPIGYATPLNREPELGPGQSTDRRLVYAYPKDRSPTRLQCAPMVFPLPQF